MNMRRLFTTTSLAAFLAVITSAAVAQQGVSPRLQVPSDAGWKFALGDPANAESTGFVDTSWRQLDLPHDWSIEGRPQKDNPTGAGGGFYPAGVGWYRKALQVPAAWQNKRVSVEFDGVYRNATIFLNGRKLGVHPNGYTSFSFDLTRDLRFGQVNLLAVRVDNSQQPNSRWYSGSGIYRHVRLVVTNNTHVAHWGVFVSTPQVSQQAATVFVQTRVVNESATAEDVVVQTILLDRAGHEVGRTQSAVATPPGQETSTLQQVPLANPVLWSPASPVLYRAVTRVLEKGKTLDSVETPFGVRSLSWSAEKGLVLNGAAIKLTGGSVHHDNGPLGAAAFDRAEVRKVELLKAAGHNMVRTAHNAPSPAFLDACDRLGLLVLDEPFDTWEAHKVKFDYASDFKEWSKQDISSLILRDRNHPSVVIWGIGNEIPELEVEAGQAIGKQLAQQVRALDNTRPLTLAFPGTTTQSTAQAVFSQLDITGYNYNLLQTYKQDHQQLPSRLMLTTESYPARMFPLWKVTQENPYILGDLTWTSMDYLGESGIGAWSYGTPQQAEIAERMMGGMATTEVIDKLFTGMANGQDMASAMSEMPSDPTMKAVGEVLFHSFPWHAAVCGDIDLIGNRRPQSFYRDIVWNGGDRVYATVRLPEPEGKKIIAVGWATYPTVPTWTWAGQEGKPLRVEVYSGAEKVQLFLNDKLIGEKLTGREQEFKATFDVRYAPGTLKAVGLRGGVAVAESVLSTVGTATSLRLTPDRHILQADGQDLAYIAVDAVDAQGRHQPFATEDVEFSVSGPGSIAAVGNGDGRDDASYQGTSRKLFDGTALLIVRSSMQGGTISITAKSRKLSSASTTIQTKLTTTTGHQ